MKKKKKIEWARYEGENSVAEDLRPSPPPLLFGNQLVVTLAIRNKGHCDIRRERLAGY
jgi:hypothetical protein